MTPRVHPGGRRAEAGFTLLEVVVAMALFAVLVTVLYSGFSIAVRAYEAAGTRTDAAARIRVISDFLRRTLGAAQPMALAGRQDWAMVFEGGEDRLSFVADLPGYLGAGGLHEVVIETARDGDRRQLLMRRRPFAVDRDGTLAGEFEDHVLLEEVGELAMRYYGVEGERGAPRWHDAWPEERRLPELVEIRLSDAGGEPWPVLLVRPQVDTVRYQNTTGPGVEQEVPPDGETPPGAGEAAPSATDRTRAPAPGRRPLPPAGLQ